MQHRLEKYLEMLIIAALCLGGIWLSFKFLLPWTAPFILAMLFAAVLEPAVKKMTRHGFKRSAASGILTLGALAVISGLLSFAAARCVEAAGDFIKKSPLLMETAGQGLERLESRISNLGRGFSQPIEGYIKSAVKTLMEELYSLPSVISQHMLDFLGKAAQKSPSILLFAVTTGLGTYFISASFPKTISFLLLQLPKSLRIRLKSIRNAFKNSLGGFFKAQLILMLMSFFQLLTAFYILKLPSPGTAAALTALIDALPVFGTGIVLIPWAVYSFILGNYSRGAGFIICWLSVNFVRSCAQAKLTGDQIGLNPIASLGAVYIGWKVWGVGGMLIFPLLFSILQQLHENGIISLWKRK